MADKEKMLKTADRVAEKLDDQMRRAKKSQTTSIVIGVILVLFLIGYFSWASSQVRSILQPDSVAQMASETMVKRIREYRPQIEDAARENAPELVDKLVDQMIMRQLPQGRKALQDALLEESDRRLAAMADYIIEEFDRIMDQHEDNVKDMVELLKTDAGMLAFQDQLYDDINTAMDDQEIAMQMDMYGEALKDFHATMKAMNEINPEDMDELQRATYDLILVTREMASRSEISLGDLPTFEGIDEAIRESGVIGTE